MKPEGVRIVRADGSELPCDLIHKGIDGDGQDMWGGPRRCGPIVTGRPGRGGGGNPASCCPDCGKPISPTRGKRIGAHFDAGGAPCGGSGKPFGAAKPPP
jgi:hypothetical protein